MTVVKDVYDVSLSHMHTDTKLEASPSLIVSAALTRASSAQASDVSMPVLSYRLLE